MQFSTNLLDWVTVTDPHLAQEVAVVIPPPERVQPCGLWRIKLEHHPYA